MAFLPAPYETDCINFGNGSRYESPDECYDDCFWTELYNRSDKTPHSVTTTQMDVDDMGKTKDTYKRQYTSIRALQNSTLQRIIDDASRMCSKKCIRPSCFEEYYATMATTSGPSKDFTIKIHSLDSPPFITNYSPKMSLTEFVIQFLSVFGIWITVDFTSLTTVTTTIHRFFAKRIKNNKN